MNDKSKEKNLDFEKSLAKLENNFKVSIITQNVDDLHERAGSSNVTHLHGELFKARNIADETSVVHWEDDIVLGTTDKTLDFISEKTSIVYSVPGKYS